MILKVVVAVIVMVIVAVRMVNMEVAVEALMKSHSIAPRISLPFPSIQMQ